jgi:hypothetical protein
MTHQKNRRPPFPATLHYHGVPHWLGRLLPSISPDALFQSRGNSGTAASRAYRDQGTDPSHFHDGNTLVGEFSERE